MSLPREPLDLTGLCSKCKKVEEIYCRTSIEQTILAVHTNHSIVCSGKRSEEKKRALEKLERITSALRNTDGGQILVHIEGQQKGDIYLEHFDEFITRRFTNLIEDGQTYVEAYQRRWLSEISDFQNETDIVLITVKKGAGIATIDFHTKLSNDIENFEPHSLAIANILLSQPIANNNPPELRGIYDLRNLYENRSREIKAFKPNPEKQSEIQKDNSIFVDYIWNNLKLKDNVTSMSKVHGGGSYYVGVSEVETVTGGYKTKVPKIERFVPPSVDVLHKAIKEKLRNCLLVLHRQRFSETPDNLLKVHFHLVPHTEPQRFVLEVSVRFFDGLVFYDKKGPRAYAMKNNRICRLDKSEWLERFEARFKSFI